MSDRKKILIGLLLFFIFVGVGPLVLSQDKVLGVDPALIQAAMAGKELIFRRKYNQALNHFAKIQEDYPQSVTGLFGKMAVWQIRMFENDDFRFKSQYHRAEKEFDKLSLRQLRRGKVPSWELFVNGAADGMRGFFKGRQGKWFKALSHGLHAMRMFKQLKWQEPKFVDVDLGFGMYKYWRSVFTNEMKFLPLFGDHRAEGIRLVKNVVDNGKYASDMALANLVFIYGQENDHQKAIQVAEQILALYPENIIIKFQKGKNYVWAKKYDQALTVFEEIYKTDSSVTKALLQQGFILFKKKEYGRSKAALEKYVGLDKQRDYLAIAYYWLGRIAEVEKDKARAVELYKKSLSLHKLKAAKTRLEKLDRR